MKQRELEADGLRWTCVQSLAGVAGDAAEAAQEKLDAAEQVIVVCTPSGGAQSVRVPLAPDWFDGMSDEQLASAIEQAHRQ